MWQQYKDKTAKGENKKEVLDQLFLNRYCCRAMFLGHIDLLSTAARFKKV
ncbi:MAG: DNA-directed RNA polymerase subunit N [Candidatus Woesearchaeota archaeon]|nr:DNA-directed RNA polymerase subunit N [Candidatus Woesearchaeota archaeon]